jgi:hypothetical protein
MKAAAALFACAIATPAFANPPTAMGNPVTVSQSENLAAVAQSRTSAQSRTAVTVQTGRGNGFGSDWRGPGTSVYAPGLTAGGIDTCLGSASGGASAGIFGLAFGSTTNDSHCRMLKDVTMLYGLGYERAALARACQDDDVAKALHDTGTDCP